MGIFDKAFYDSLEESDNTITNVELSTAIQI